MALLDDNNTRSAYIEILQAKAWCDVYRQLCKGEIRFRDGSAYSERTVTLDGRKCSEELAYISISSTLLFEAMRIADLDEYTGRPEQLPEYHAYYYHLKQEAAEQARNDDEFWAAALLRVSHAKSIPCESSVEKKIGRVMEMLYEVSHHDEERTYEIIRGMWTGEGEPPKPPVHSTTSSISAGGGSSSSGGCFVATAVYGSYDCPEVWTLRRFRDDVLAVSGPGRLFIRTYYSVSPKMVELFGKSKVFQRMFRGPLDSLVASCKSHGISSEPYREDKPFF